MTALPWPGVIWDGRYYLSGCITFEFTTVIELNAIKSFTTCVEEAPRESTFKFMLTINPSYECQLITYFC